MLPVHIYAVQVSKKPHNTRLQNKDWRWCWQPEKKFFWNFIVMSWRKRTILTMPLNSTWKTAYIGLGYSLGGAWPPGIVCHPTVRHSAFIVEFNLRQRFQRFTWKLLRPRESACKIPTWRFVLKVKVVFRFGLKIPKKGKIWYFSPVICK